MTPATVTLSLAALLGALAAGEPCDFGAIQGVLFENATAGLERCAAETGVDVWALAGFPSEAQVAAVQQNRGCVDFLNQVNQRANTLVQCDVAVGGETVVFGELLVDFLTGQTGNATDAAEASAAASSSEDIVLPDSDAGSSDADEDEASGSSEDEDASEVGDDDVGDASSRADGSVASGAAGATALSMAAAGAALACALSAL